MIIDLSNKTAVVTGSTLGIGFAIAKGLAQSGATVIVNGRTEKAVGEAIGALKRGAQGGDPRRRRRSRHG
jgi:NAD(P)-dependent dehydrogenase (short-subunit alcohol dehydrogenase family)